MIGRDGQLAAPEARLADPVRSEGSSAASGVIWLSAAQAVMVVASYAVHVVTARALPAGDYARAAVVLSIVAWLRTFQASLVLPGLHKIVSEDPARLGTAVRFAGRWYALASGALAGLVALSAGPVAAALGDAGLAGLILLAAGDVLLAGVQSAGRWLLLAVRRYAAAAAIQAGYAAGRAAAIALLVLLGFGAGGAMVGQVIGAALGAAAGAVLLLGAARGLPRVDYPPLAGRTARWTALTLPADAAIATLACLDLWMVNRLMPAETAGLYAAGWALSRLPLMGIQALVSAVGPKASSALAEGRPAIAAGVAREAVRLAMLVASAAVVLLGSNGRALATLLFSDRYAAAGDVVALLTASVALCGGWLVLLSLVAACDAPGVKLRMTLGALPVGLLLQWLLIGRLGATGAALAGVLTFALSAAVALAWLRRRLGLGLPTATLLRASSAAGAAWLAGLLWPTDGAMVMLKLPAQAALWLALLAAMRELTRADLTTLAAALRRGRRAPE